MRHRTPSARRRVAARRPFRPSLGAGADRLEARALLATINVTTTLDAINPNDGLTSLREAVATANGTDGATTIVVPAGTYNLTNAAGEMLLGSRSGQEITVRGAGAAATVINQSVAGSRIFNIDNNVAGNVDVILAGLTVQGAANVNRANGGGAILAGGPGDSLTVQDCVFQNNSTASSTARLSGGAIAVSGGGDLRISGSTFRNNTAGGNASVGAYGGAISYNNSNNLGNLLIENSTFAGNAATGTNAVDAPRGGAIYLSTLGNHSITRTTFDGNVAAGGRGGAVDYAAPASQTTLAVANSTFTNNRAAAGGALSGSSPGSVTFARLGIAGSRFFNNSATVRGEALSNDGSVATANDNWWGADAFPDAAGTDTVATTAGTTTLTTRLALTLAASPARVSVNGSATLTASVVSTAALTTPVAGTALDGLALTFAPGTLGSVSPTSVVLANGTASATFNAGPTAGATSPTVRLDNGIKTTSITVAGVPTANNQRVAVAFNTARALTLTGADPGNPPLVLTYSIVSAPARGTLSGFNPSTGAVTYTPNAGSSGTDTFTFRVSNGTNASNLATVTLDVAPGTPTANGQTAATDQDRPVSLTLAGTDPNTPPRPLTYSIASGPAFGTLSGFNPATGAVTYTPNAGYFGPDSFTFVASNGAGTSAPATVGLTVNRVRATVGGSLGVGWGAAGAATLQTVADGLRLLPAGRSATLPWLGINRLTITLDRAATLLASDVSVTGVNVASYGPVTLTGSGTTYTITLARPIEVADRVTLTVGNAGVVTFTRRLDVLPGDVNDDGVVTQADAVLIRNQYLGFSGALPTASGDVNGDGVVDVSDYNEARRRIGTVLP